MSPLSEAEVRETFRWVSHYSDIQHDVPMRLHESPHGTHYGLGSAPPFSGEFVGYIGYLYCQNPRCTSCKKRRAGERTVIPGYRQPESKTRTKRAFRKLRAVAPLEYDVLWLAVMHKLTITEIVARLNKRREESPDTFGVDPEFTPLMVAVLATSGVHKIQEWW